MTGDAATEGDDSSGVLDEIVGPFWDTDGVTRFLSENGDDLTARIETDQIIWVPLSSGTPVFPAWQFDGDRDVRDSLLTVWLALRQAADPWTAAVWMCSPARALDGQPAIAHLAGDPTDARRLALVLAMAAEDTNRWRQ